MKKGALSLALLAGSAMSTVALAQEENVTPLPWGGEVRLPIVSATVGGATVNNPANGGGYSGRAVDTVYDCLTNGFQTANGATHLGACSQILEDISFAPGPWATQANRLITEITYGVGVITTPTTTEDIMLIFWDEDDVNFQGFTGAGTNMINPAAVPLAVVRVDSAGLGAGFYWQITNALTGLPGGGVTVPAGDAGVALQVAWVNDGFTPATSWSDISAGIYGGCASTTDRALVFCSQSLAPVGGNAAAPGFTSISYGRDISNANMCANIGRFIGNGAAPATGGDVEHRTIAASPQRGYMVRFKGDVAGAPQPTCNGSFGSIPDGTTTQTNTVAASSVKWHCITLPSGVDDLSRKFLNIDTEGSTGDVAIALYNDAGSLAGTLAGVAQDDGSGSGTNDQLTFGVGRLAAVGDGQQYDGRHGQLAAGTYWIAVAPSGSTFSGGYNVTASANAGGAYSLNVRTNLNGAAAPAPVAPIVAATNDYGTLDPSADGAVPGAAETTGIRGVLWRKFTLATPADSSHFLDIDFAAFGYTPSADGVAYIFNSSGDVMYFSDDEGPDALPQFSIGAAGSRNHGTNTVAFDGNTPPGANAGLPAGTYYMAMGLFATQDLLAVPAPHRFHVRGTSGSSLNVNADLYVGPSGGGCPGNQCGPQDYNGDGDSGTDQDIEAFFACLGGNCCPTCFCQGSDFNGDGDFGTDQDIEAFFRVLGGNNC